MCLDMIPKIRDWGPDCVAAVMPDGMTAAHIYCNELNLPCGAYFKDTNHLALPNTNVRKILFVDDFIKKGFNIFLLNESFTEYNNTLEIPYEWKIVSLVIHRHYRIMEQDNVLTYSEVNTKCFFPYSNEERS